MLAPHEDAVQLALRLRTLETAGQLVVGTYDEVQALQAMNSRIEADPASPAGFALTLPMGSGAFMLTLRRMSTGEAAEAAGLPRFDTALPQPWVDRVIEAAGDPRGHFVWSYAGDRVSGEPFPTTTHGVHLLDLFTVATARA